MYKFRLNESGPVKTARQRIESGRQRRGPRGRLSRRRKYFGRRFTAGRAPRVYGGFRSKLIVRARIDRPLISYARNETAASIGFDARKLIRPPSGCVDVPHTRSCQKYGSRLSLKTEVLDYAKVPQCPLSSEWDDFESDTKLPPNAQ
ncbi:hypothetical protein EVAR_23643_1 [Eumeta japonica]|uniref:Uncharacterized protein n=1 Tax=Eumeta variegata TaxID=151549 RepID=A0A4C1VIM4_EUMVA|nr:hypothetical protein EVAR_23643_1 [Eumeta japonica]